MKNLKLFALLTPIILMSCVKTNENPGGSKPSINEKYLLTTPYTVEVKEGFATEVMMGEERLALTDIPLTIEIPKGLSTQPSSSPSRAGEEALTVKFYKLGSNDKYDGLPEFEKGTGISEKTHVLMFEDSRNGDYDYNDFVVLVKHTTKTVKEGKVYKYGYDFVVKPIALGASKNIKFGFTDENDGKTVYFTQDIRKDYFNGSKGMVNTYPSETFVAPLDDSQNKHNFLEIGGPVFERIILENFNKTEGDKLDLMGGYYKYVAYTTPIANINNLKMNVNYFIEVDQIKLYVAEANVTTGGKLPYGLAIPSSIKKYPFEKELLSDLYKGFDKWVADTNSNLNWYKAASGEGFGVDFPALYRWYPQYEY